MVGSSVAKLKADNFPRRKELSFTVTDGAEVLRMKAAMIWEEE
jgi:hypothetical protein